jgi:uncharacterized NAD(P)/FAD-binding protein YdhS
VNKETDILIIGDGFSAAVAMIHLLRQGIDAQSIAILGKRVPGRGNAYGCISPAFRLNVREDLPIIFSEDPLHFARWAIEHIDDPQAKTSAGYFYRRNDFGTYMSQLVTHELGGRTLNRIQGEAQGISGSDGQWRVLLKSGESIHAKAIILATGNATPIWPCPMHVEQTSSHLTMTKNPWPGDYLRQIPAKDHVLLIGGGLTALDAINGLVEQGHQGQVTVISPRALFPPSQAPWTRTKQPQWPNPITPARLVRFMRQYLPSTPTDQSEWQCAWEELRPDLNQIWQGFNAHQRRILMKRFGWLWNLYRFRSSPQTIAAYHQLRDHQQIEFRCGRAKEIVVRDRVIHVILNDGEVVGGQHLINCTGVARDLLLDQLTRDAIASPDALKSSIAINPQLAVLDARGKPYQSLWMIGPATMGSLGDVIAASAIAKQAEQLAKAIRLNWIPSSHVQ